MIELFWTLLGTLIALLTYLAYQSHKQGTVYKKQGFAYLGNGIYRLILAMKGQTFTDNITENYWKSKSSKNKIGIGQEFNMKTYFLTDLEIAKQVFVKDFDHFVDRRTFKTTKGDPYMGKMLISLKGDRWKSVRSKMSPTFTTGKIRRMYETVDQSGQRMIDFVKNQIKHNSTSELDLQKGYSKFTMDVVASIAFGIDSKAFDQEEPSLFEHMGAKLAFNFSALSILKFMVIIMIPRLGDILRLSMFSAKSQEFYAKAIKSAMKHRRENKEVRNDFLQLMMQVREGKLQIDKDEELSEFEKEAQITTQGEDNKNEKITLDDDDIVAQSILFLLGGYDTTLSTHLFCGYNFALHPEIQERVYQEIKHAMEQNDGKMTFDILMNQLEYTDMFIKETLRMYPAAVIVERSCTKDFKIPNTENTIEKGSIVIIPVWGIHRDPQYFPQPEKFNPERFAPENKSDLHPYAYMPFGHGPRNCIGMRLALMEIKVAIVHLVCNFVLEPSPKTPIPMKFGKSGALKPEGGLFLKLTPRK